MPSEARACAHAVLRRVFDEGAYADRAFHSAAASLGPRDRALAMRIAYGAVQRAGSINVTIEQLTKRRLARLDPAVRAALTAGIFELLHLDGSPDHAVVDDTVELAKRSGSHGVGLVNAVMRRAAAERAELLGDRDDSTPEGAAHVHSHPRWIAELWWEHLGGERARSLMAADNEPSEAALRVNTLLADPAELTAQLPVVAPSSAAAPSLATAPSPAAAPSPVSLRGVDLPEALLLSGPLDVAGSSLWRSGAIVAQSRAAMLVSHVLGPRRGERVLDLCAAPGGKSTHIAALMGGEGEVIAVEAHPGRAKALRETVQRMGAERVVSVECADAATLRPAGQRFDRVLLDAPCSGLGTLQQHPDLRWRMTPERMKSLAELQGRLLAAAASAVGDGGVLVYSTCTISPAENERQIEAFLHHCRDFTLEALSPPQPAGGADRLLLTGPDIDRTAGFFIARMRRG